MYVLVKRNAWRCTSASPTLPFDVMLTYKDSLCTVFMHILSIVL
jgi:hypothetical protein